MDDSGEQKADGAIPAARLALSDDWYRALLEQTLAGIYLIQDGYFRYVNQEFANIFGYASPADIVDKIKIAEFIVPEDRAMVAENVRRRSSGEVTEMRYSFVGLCADGRRIDVEVHGRAMQHEGRPAVIGLLLDVTQRKLEEAAADEKLRALFEHSPLGIALVDPQGRHLECNAAYRRLLACPDDAMQATDMWSLIPPRFSAEVAAMQRSLAASGSYGAIELEYRRSDGQPVPVQAHGVRIAGSDRREFVWSIVEDIAERKRLEAETAQQVVALKALNQRLQDAQTQLLQSEKLAAVGQLAAGVAHEINNPIGFVTSNLATLDRYAGRLLAILAAYEASEARLPAEAGAALAALRAQEDLAYMREDLPALLKESREGLERVKRIVADLKDFSHVDEAEWQVADIEHGIDSTLNVVWNEIKYKAEVIKEYGHPPPLRCLPFQLNQVVMNLLMNAAQAIDGRGTITIRTGQRDRQAQIEIADTGSGIAPADLRRIFEPFYTTKPVGKGTGLGLSLSYGIVQKHRGRIEVESEPGKGSTFRVWLPLDAA